MVIQNTNGLHLSLVKFDLFFCDDLINHLPGFFHFINFNCVMVK